MKNKVLVKLLNIFYIFLKTLNEVQSNFSDSCINHYNVESLNLFDPELQLINTKPVFKSKLKALLN